MSWSTSSLNFQSVCSKLEARGDNGVHTILNIFNMAHPETPNKSWVEQHNKTTVRAMLETYYPEAAHIQSVGDLKQSLIPEKMMSDILKGFEKCYIDLPKRKMNTASGDLLDQVDQLAKRYCSDWDLKNSVTIVGHEIMEKGETDFLTYSHYWVISTLLYGDRIGLIYPPSLHNMRICTSAFSQKDDAESDADLISQLEGGLSYFQEPGDTLCIPPYCIKVTCSTFSKRTSLAVRWDVYSSFTLSTVRSLEYQLPRLQWLNIFKHDNETLRKIGRELLPELVRVLQSDLVTYNRNKVPESIREAWKLVYLAIHTCADQTGDMEWGEKLAKAWAILVCNLQGRSKDHFEKQECPLCDKPWTWGKHDSYPRRQGYMISHIKKAHW